MARMWARGGVQRFETRAVVAILSGIVAAALVTGSATAVMVSPGAVGRPNPPTRTAASDAAHAFPSARLPVAAGGHGRAPASNAVVVPSSLSPADPVTAFTAEPTTEAQVAADIIGAVDARSGGRFAIVATPDNVALLETWMNNEGGLWADNPLNTSLDAARYPDQFTTAGADTGIPIFPDIQIGIDATANTLLSGLGYADILAVLSDGTATCGAFARAVIASPWAASHYGGDPARFCGASGASVTVPATTACPSRPHRGGRRDAPASAPCGRKARHSGLPRRARGRSPSLVVHVHAQGGPERSHGTQRLTQTLSRPTEGPARAALSRPRRISGGVRRPRR